MTDPRPSTPDVVLPVLDEAAAIPGVLASLPDGWTAIVIDNGSTDGSADIARRLGARVVYEPQRGFGAACAAGLHAARADIVCFMDCDGSLDGAALPRMVAPIVAGTTDLMLGTRHATPGSWPLHLRIANRSLARRVNQRYGTRLTDLGPMRAARRVGLLELGIRDRRSGWPLEMVLRAADAGWCIDETSVEYRPRIGRSKVTGTLRGALRTVQDMRAVLA